MKNLLAFVAAVVLTLVGVGWYLGWYQIRVTPAPAGHERVDIDINAKKVTEDLHRGEESVLQKGQAKLQGIVDQAGKDLNKPAPEAPKPGPFIPPPGSLLEESEPPAHYNAPQYQR